MVKNKSKKKVVRKKKVVQEKELKVTGKKKLMVDALIATLGIITGACKKTEISRETHYRWLREDHVYRKLVEELPEITLDVAENALLKKINAGETKAIIFYLKTKGKKRGYIEKQEVAIEGIIATTSLTKEERQAEIKRLLGK